MSLSPSNQNLHSPILWIKNPKAIYTANALNADNGLLIQGRKIIELVAKGSQPTQPYNQVFDASNHVVTPGLVNTHHHFYQTLTRACPPALNKKLFPWLQTLYPIWSRLTPEQHALATEMAMVELLLSGCTTVSDHHYLFPAGLESAIDIQVKVALKLGINATFTRGSMSLGHDQGGLPPQSVVQNEAVIMADSERLIQQYHQKDPYKMIEIALAPCSPFSVTPELMKSSAELAQRFNVGLHTHLSETEDENEFCIKRFGLRPVDYLESVNWMTNKTWLAHGIHFNDEEITRLGQHNVGVCHCPSSNMVLASGICKVKALQNAGVRVGLGVDGSASNDHSNLMQEVRQALLIQRLRYDADEFTHLDALHLATKGSAELLRRDNIGHLSIGAQADIALYTLDEPRFSGSHDPLAALVLCGAHRADAVMIAGEWKVQDGEWLGGDVKALMHRHHKAAQVLFSKD